MQKRSVMFLLLSLVFLIGQSCESSQEIKSLDECTRIQNIDARIRCSDNYYIETAKELGDSSLCVKILNTNLKQDCESLVLNAIEDPETEREILSPEQENNIGLEEGNEFDLEGNPLPPIPTE